MSTGPRGSGPEVEGTGEALLVAMAGRRVALDELTRPGVVPMAERHQTLR